MEEMNTVFITGASGFIGRHLVEELAGESEYRIRCLIHHKAGKEIQVHPDIAAVRGDLLDKESVRKAAGEAGIYIHLASVINAKSKGEFERVNVNGMKNITEVASGNRVQKFIYISTIDAGVNPDSLYGRSKLEAEGILKNTPLTFTILRPSVVYGEHDDKNVALMMRMVKRFPAIPIIGDGEYKRQPLYVDDLIYAIRSCLVSGASDARTYNIGGPEAVSINAMFSAIQQVLGRQRHKIHLPVAAIKNAYSVLGRLSKSFNGHAQQILSIDQDKLFDIRLARQELEFNPIDFKNGLKIMLKVKT